MRSTNNKKDNSKNQQSVPSLMGFIKFIESCRHFIKLINEEIKPNDDELEKIKGRILLNHKKVFKETYPNHLGLDEVQKYLKLVKLDMEDSEEIVLLDGKPLISINIIKWVCDNEGLANKSTHNKEVYYKTPEGLGLNRGQHTRSGILERQNQFSQHILKNNLDTIFVGGFFSDDDLGFQPNYRQTNFSNLNLDYSNFHDALLEDSIWLGTTARCADMRKVTLKGANLSYADLSSADLRGAKIFADNKNKTQAIETNFSYADMRGSRLAGTDCRRANFTGVMGHEMDFTDCFLEGAKFDNADMRNAEFFPITRKLGEANFLNSRMNLRHTNFNSANLTGAELEIVDMTGANLSNVNLENATFMNVVLDGADLSGANFKNTKVRSLNVTAHQLAKAKNIHLIFYKKSATLEYSYEDLCNKKENDLTGTQRFLKNLISNALAIQQRQKQEKQIKSLTPIYPVEIKNNKTPPGKEEVGVSSALEIENANKIEKISEVEKQEIHSSEIQKIQVTSMEPQKEFSEMRKQKNTRRKARKKANNGFVIETPSFIEAISSENVNVVIKEEKPDSNSNAVIAKDHSDVPNLLSRREKRKAKTLVSEERTEQTTTTQTEPKVQLDASVSQHGIFNRNAAGEHFIQRYQNTIKGICVTLLGLGCLWATNFITQQSEDEHPKNMTNFRV